MLPAQAGRLGMRPPHGSSSEKKGVPQLSIDIADHQPGLSEEDETTEEDSGSDLEDSLSLYFRGVRRAPLLTRQQEHELFRRKDAGDDRAKRILVEANLRLVIWVARQYASYNVPFLDLIQEGNLALTRAVEKFDHRLGCKLSTYATLLIKQAIEQAANRHARVVPVPITVRRQISAVRRAQQLLRQRLSREPLLGELAAETGVAAKRIAELLDYEQPPISLEGSLGEGESAVVELLEDPRSAYPEATLAERLRREEVESLLHSLDDRLRRVVALRFGLSGQSPQSLVEVGRELGVTPERARQLEVRALEKLRKLAPGLRDYLEVA